MAPEPVFTVTPRILPTPTTVPVPVFTVTLLDRSGTYAPVISYDYVVPDQWQAVIGDDEIVLEDPSGTARVTLRELQVDRSQVDSLSELILVDQPDDFVDWADRSLSDSRTINALAHEFSYAGTKYGEQYVATVRWQLRGELLIEVTTEATAAGWAGDSRLRNRTALAAASFTSFPDLPVASLFEIENQLMVRFGQRPSGIFQSQNGGSGTAELTCRDVFSDLLSTPLYSGSGTWQVFAVGDQGAQVWQIFEPSQSIVPAAHNTSAC